MKGLINIFIISVATIIFGVIAGIYFYSRTKSEEKIDQQKIKTTVPTVASRQDAYKNSKYGYQIKIPDNWRVANLFTSFIEAQSIIGIKYENGYPNLEEDNFIESAKEWEDAHAAEKRDLMVGWKPEQSEWMVLSNLSENQEGQFYSSVFAGEKNFLDFPGGTITIQPQDDPAIPSDFKEINNERSTRKKITLPNGQFASYSQLYALGVTLVSIPLKEQSNKLLINGKSAKSLLIELKSSEMSQDQFLKFINTIQTF